MKNLRFTTFICTCALITSFSSAQAAPASDDDVRSLLNAVDAQAKRLSEQEQNIALQLEEIKRQQRQLMVEKNEFNKLKTKVEDIKSKRGIVTTTDDAERASDSTSGTSSTERPQVVGTDRKPEEEEKPPEIAAVIEQGGVLLKEGGLVVTPAVEYSRSSATRVAIDGFSIIPAINIGLFEVSRVARDTITSSVGVRYGLTNRIEVETRVPYVYRSDSTVARPIGTGASSENRNEVSSDNIGDVEFGAHYQINNGGGGWPFFIGNIRFKTNTGTSPFEVAIDTNGLPLELATGSGFYALQPSVTAIFPSDPVVYYSNVGYLYNFARDFGGTIGEIDPGDSINASFGMSLSLNDKASFSVGYSHNTVFETEQNGVVAPTATKLQVGSVDLGYSYNLNESTNINFGVSAGITEDAPDARLTVRVPITFDTNSW